MNRVSRASLRSRALVALAACSVALILGACTQGGTDSDRVTPKHQPVYPQVKTYPDIKVTDNVDFGRADGTPRELDVCFPKETAKTDAPRAAVLSIHGGSWAHGDKSNLNWRSVCQWLASEKFVAFSIGYRLAPEHPFPAGINDVKAAVRWLRQPANARKYNIDPDRIGVFGGSAGGNLAALLGTSGSGSLTNGARVAAVAELSGPADLTVDGPEAEDFAPYELRYLGCTSLDNCPAARRASPLYQVDKTDPPFFIGHSLNERIPLAQSSALVKALRAHNVDTTFVTVKGRLHSIAMLNTEMRTRIADFLHSKLDTRTLAP